MSIIMKVDMTTKKITTGKNPDYNMLGGRALSARILLDEVAPNCEPFGAKNKLVIAPGLLAGTPVTSGSRISCGAKSPMTNGIKEANCGGNTGIYLGRFGIKAVVIEGEPADDNAYVLKIGTDGASLLVMNELKLSGTYETDQKLRAKFGTDIGVLCIGPAGENRLKMALIASSDPNGELRFAARGGLGAVMGSKGIKAIVVDKTLQQPVYHDRQKFMDMVRSIHAEFIDDPKIKQVNQKTGTATIVKAVNAMGALPTCNFRQGAIDGVDGLSGETMYETIINRGGEGKTGVSCMDGCLIKCSNIYPDASGKKICSTLQYENIALLGSNLGFTNLDPVAKLNHECDDIGVDAIEAGAHAYAARHGRYSSLTEWWKDEAGNLRGSIEMPMKVGIVGGPLESNPGVAMNLRLLGVKSATELAEVMAAVGLAQNFAALRALATDGIQAGHMTLHARSVVKAAGAPAEHFNEVLERVLQSGEIKVWKAQQILEEVRQAAPADHKPGTRRLPEVGVGVGFGKIILLGEHAVVHGRHAIGCPVPLTIRAIVEDGDRGVELLIPRWGVEYQLAKPPEQRRSFEQAAGAILDKLGLARRTMRIEVFPDVPRGMGLGGSAALAVAIVRALDLHFHLGLSDAEVNELAYLSEQNAHGQPSGIDNTLATYGKPLVFRRGTPPLVEPLNIPQPLSIVVGMTQTEGLTARTVANVAEARLRNPRLYEKIFDDIDGLVLQAVSAIQDNDVDTLGDLMNINQGLLNALQVSTPELERLINVARDAGAAGAKLTGGGGGGAMIALCSNAGTTADVQQAIERQGFRTLLVTAGGVP